MNIKLFFEALLKFLLGLLLVGLLLFVPANTINYWNTVRSGEEKHIYPYINNIDRIVNTSLVYELGVLKVFAEPLLYSVKEDSTAYYQARRLINNLKGFYPIPSDYVPDESVLREFIGKSVFEHYK